MSGGRVDQPREDPCQAFYSGFHLIVRTNRLSLERMAAYSIDLRQKILHAYERRLGSQRALAHVFGISLAFVEKVLRQHRTLGTIAPKPHAGGQKPRLDGATHALLRQLVRDHPDRSEEHTSELQSRLH